MTENKMGLVARGMATMTPKRKSQNPTLEELQAFQPKIAVVGVGGAGSNAVNHMILKGMVGVDFLVCNTDAQALSQALTPNRFVLLFFFFSFSFSFL